MLRRHVTYRNSSEFMQDNASISVDEITAKLVANDQLLSDILRNSVLNKVSQDLFQKNASIECVNEDNALRILDYVISNA